MPSLQHQHAAQRRAGDGHEEAEHLGHTGDLRLAVTEVEIERIGHDAHGDIAEAEHGDKDQHHQGKAPVALHELEEGTDHRAEQLALPQRAGLRCIGRPIT
jgi:hypothetical protein